MSNIIDFLTEKFTSEEKNIEEWFASKYQNLEPLIYSSVDLRCSNHKIAPIDTNIFPAGFNNLSETAREIAASGFARYIAQYYPKTSKILLIAESHSRNVAYLENIKSIKELLNKAGYQVEIAVLEADEKTIYPQIKKKDDLIYIANFTPDLIIINNDLTSGHPEILENIKQNIIPEIYRGWYKRQKHKHFSSYAEICNEFCRNFSLPKFLLSAEFAICQKINFKERKGLECIAIEVEKTLRRIRENYKKFSIKDEPYVFLKADRGTYGMGIMTISDPEEVFALNKKNRNKMNVIKNKTQNAAILIQEGIATIDIFNSHPAEPFIYQIAGKTAGIIYRYNQKRDAYISLNSSGAEFSGIENLREFKGKYLVYDVIARLASLAACLEADTLT